MTSSSSRPHPESAFLHILEGIKQKALKENLNLNQLIDLFGDRSHQLLIFFIVLPFMQPIPLLGLSTPLGILIAIIALYERLHLKPWIPKSWGQKQLPSEVIVKSTDVAHRFWEKLGHFIYARLRFLKTHPFFAWTNFAMVATSAILLALPLPIPFSNMVPNIVIFSNAIGQLEEDGVVILISYVAFILSLIFFAGIFVGAGVGIESLLQKYK